MELNIMVLELQMATKQVFVQHSPQIQQSVLRTSVPQPAQQAVIAVSFFIFKLLYL
jgi:hypothetical protein